MTSYEMVEDPENIGFPASIQTRIEMGRRILSEVSVAALSPDEYAILPSIFRGINDLYQSSQLREEEPYFSSQNELNAARWAMSGLKASWHADKIHDFTDLSLDSLVHSIKSGSIRTVVSYEAQVELMQKVAAQVRGGDIPLGTFDFAEYQSALDAYREELAFVHHMAFQASRNTYQGRYRAGPHKDIFHPIVISTQQRLAEIHPDLTMDVIHEHTYRTPQTVKLVNNLTALPRNSRLIREVRTQWIHALHDIAKDHEKITRNHTLTQGILDTPLLIRQSLDTSCANSAFRMVYQGVCGEILNEDDLGAAIRNAHHSVRVHDEEYLKFFETDAFKEKYGLRVQSMQFMGMTLDTIEDVARRLKSKTPEAKIFVTVALHSEKEHSLNIQHRVILLHANRQNVTVLDPRYRKQKVIGKDEFSYRWARTQDSGYLVIAA